VLVDRGRISVVDWEAFHYGAPLEDFFTFALGTVFRQLLGVERGAELIRNVFLGSSPLSTRIWAGAARILAREGLSQDLLRTMFLMYLMNRTVRVHFADSAALRAFACQYVDMGMPTPGRFG
jgi:aminoglycoside phosphotransferase (APT) family kinase protein